MTMWCGRSARVGRGVVAVVAGASVGSGGCSGLGSGRPNALDDTERGCRAIALLGDGTARGAPDEAARAALARLRAVVDWREETDLHISTSPSGRSLLVTKSLGEPQRFIREWWDPEGMVVFPRSVQASVLTEGWLIAEEGGRDFLVPAAAPLDGLRRVYLPFRAGDRAVLNGDRLAFVESRDRESEPVWVWRGLLSEGGVSWEPPIDFTEAVMRIGLAWSPDGRYLATTVYHDGAGGGAGSEDVVAFDLSGHIVSRALDCRMLDLRHGSPGPDACFLVGIHDYYGANGELFTIGRDGELLKEFPGVGFGSRMLESFSPGGRCACVLTWWPTSFYLFGKPHRDAAIVRVPINSLSHEDMYPVRDVRAWLCWPPGSGAGTTKHPTE
jgi:hypothetical protein